MFAEHFALNRKITIHISKQIIRIFYIKRNISIIDIVVVIFHFIMISYICITNTSICYLKNKKKEKKQYHVNTLK